MFQLKIAMATTLSACYSKQTVNDSFWQHISFFISALSSKSISKINLIKATNPVYQPRGKQTSHLSLCWRWLSRRASCNMTITWQNLICPKWQAHPESFEFTLGLETCHSQDDYKTWQLTFWSWTVVLYLKQTDLKIIGLLSKVFL